MNIDNGLNTAAAKAPEFVAHTANNSTFGSTITSCLNNYETCSTRTRIGFTATAAAAVGATLMGPCGLGAVLMAKISPAIAYTTCSNAVGGAYSCFIGGVLGELCTDCSGDDTVQVNQNAKPVTTQPAQIKQTKL